MLDGKPTSASYEWGLWGATLGGGEDVARSAIGQNSAGDIMYAGSMSTTPYDLARALSKYGARTGMELDINPAWVQLDVAHAARRPPARRGAASTAPLTSTGRLDPGFHHRAELWLLTPPGGA